MRLTAILLVGLGVILTVACQTGALAPAKKERPAVPTLEGVEMPDGGMCVNRPNFVKLSIYIAELEHALDGSCACPR